MVRNQYGSFVPAAHILTQKEDSDIVAVLRQIREYCQDRWTPKWVLTDDSAGKT